MTLGRLIEYTSRRSIWDIWDSDDNIEYTNEERLDKWLPIGQIAATSLVILGLILNIACIKWRWLARAFFHIEMLQIMLRKMIPMEICIGSTFSIFFEPFFYSLCFFVDIKSNLFTLAVCTIVGNLILTDIWMPDDLQFQLSPVMALIFLVGLIIIFLSCILTYVAQLQKKLRMQMSEYFNLINRMREGVLVLSAKTASSEGGATRMIEFCNRVVMKIFRP